MQRQKRGKSKNKKRKKVPDFPQFYEKPGTFYGQR